MKPSRVLSLPLRALARLLRPLAKLLPSPRLPKLPEVSELPRPGQMVKKLRAGSSASDKGRKKEIAAPHEADLPAALAQAAGLPVQHATLVAVPVEIAYNQFTQFEEFPTIMSTVATVDQIDPAQVEFELRHWKVRRSCRAHIVDQRPEERIAWRSVDGMRLAGVTTFHAVSDRLTRMDVSVVVEPANAPERIAHRTGLIGRLIAGDLQRFKAFVEMREEETGAWRGYIADGEVVDEDEYFGWEVGASNGASADTNSKSSGAGKGRARKKTGGSRSRA
ncbi:MAG: SRPBCC family protein [Actinomycetota bacterium]|nr:SRPBCC family protein [Actinomycetota bacterium]